MMSEITYEFLVITCKSEEVSNFFNIGWGFQPHKCLNFVGKWKNGHSPY